MDRQLAIVTIWGAAPKAPIPIGILVLLGILGACPRKGPSTGPVWVGEGGPMAASSTFHDQTVGGPNGY